MFYVEYSSKTRNVQELRLSSFRLRTTFAARKIVVIDKLTSVFHAVCPVSDDEFRHNIVKVAVDPQSTLTML